MNLLGANLLYLLAGLLALTILLVLYVIFKTVFRKKKLSSSDLTFIRSKWDEIGRELAGNSKLAVLEADKLLDYTLGKLGKKGNLGEKLRNSKKLFSDLNAVWAAHKLRNRIAHEVSLELAPTEAAKAIRNFERALRDLKAL